MESLIGNSFILNSGKSATLADVVKPDTKAIGLYFSAHWCPPCRGFTPLLAKHYVDSLKAKGLEIIFISSDRDEKAFSEYHAEMPWFALPYKERELKNKLSSKFKIQGIPSLVILDTKGEMITDQGRMQVMKDPQGLNFPWRPKSALDLLKDGRFVGKDGKSRTLEEVTKDVQAVGLYFSASWCGPCHRFTPVLAAAYNKLKQEDSDAKRAQRFEVIFLSSDRDAAAFNKYYGEMPWHALEFENSDLKEALEERFKVEGIPTLVVLDPKTGASINEDTVGAVYADPKAENFPWAPKSVEILDEYTAGNIGPTPALFVFCESNDQAKQVRNDLSTAVDVWRGKAEEGAVCHGDVCIPTGGKLAGTEDTLFYVCGEHPIVAKVRELAQANGVVVALLDLAGAAPTYAHGEFASVEKVTPMALRKFLADYYSGKVEKKAVTPPARG